MRVLEACAADFTVQHFLLPLIDRLSEGHQVVIVCGEGPFVPQLRAAGYDVRTVPFRRSLHPVAAIRTVVHLMRLMKSERFDIVHTHTPIASALVRIAAWLAGIPRVVYTVHGFYFHDDMPVLKRNLFIMAEKFLGRITDMMFSQSREDAEAAIRLGICSEARVHWISNGVDLARFDPTRLEEANPDRKAILRALGIVSTGPVVGMIARLVREKGIREYVDAAITVLRHRPDVHFLLVGSVLDSDYDGAVSDVVRRIEDAGLQNKITLPGFCSDVPAMLHALDMFVLPSYREGMPRSLIEAMAMAKPVVATRIRGSRELVDDDTTGILVPPHDAGALAEAISSLLSDPERALAMGRAGRQRALNHFDEQRVISRQIDLLNGLLAQPKRS